MQYRRFPSSLLFLTLAIPLPALALGVRLGPSAEMDYVSLGSPVTSGDTDKNGLGTGAAAKLVVGGGKYGELDSGLGFLYTSVSGSGRKAQIANPFLQVGYHYPAPYHLLPGIISRLHWGPAADYDPANEGRSLAIFKLGPELAYEIPRESDAFRITLSYLFDINNSTRNVQTALATVQYLFDFIHPSPERPRQVASSTPPAVVAAPRETAKTPESTINLALRRLQYARNSADLTPDTSRIARGLGKALSDHQNAWGTIEISGHADRSGNETHNVVLSEKRAETVKDSLVKSGIDPSRITAKGYGSSQPLEGLSPYAPEQRRVEVKLHNVAAGQELQRALDQEVGNEKHTP